MAGKEALTAQDVLRRYEDEDLPDFLEMRFTDVNQVGLFGNTPLEVAAVRGDLEEIDALLAAGADHNARCELGCTPLHGAAGQGHAEAVTRLLRAGASTDLLNEFGDIPRETALRGGKADVVAAIDAWTDKARKA
ncbi:MAG: ankyrin repeat domain-containing protein [Pseudomonadota bacterium]